MPLSYLGFPYNSKKTRVYSDVDLAIQEHHGLTTTAAIAKDAAVMVYLIFWAICFEEAP